MSGRRCCVAVALVLCALFPIGAGAQTRATVRKQTVDARPAVVMENEFIRMVFAPEKGGQCVDFLYKPAGKRMFMRGRGALLGNRVWNYADRGLYSQWQKMAWSSDIEQRPGEARLVRPSIIEECIAHLECRVAQEVEAGDHHLVIAEVLAAYTRPGVLDDNGLYDLSRVHPLLHLGRNRFSTTLVQSVEPPLPM